MTYKKQLTNIRRLLIFFMIVLALSGITAFPLENELRLILENSKGMNATLYGWLQQVYTAISATNQQYPFLQYGYDWLAFAHLMIALFFIGPYRDPIRNIWVIEWGMIACICIVPLALICGPIRGIPLYWQWIDCSFGILGMIPLFICRRWIKKLSRLHR